METEPRYSRKIMVNMTKKACHYVNLLYFQSNTYMNYVSLHSKQEQKTNMNISAFMMGVGTAFFTIFALHILLWRKNRTRFQNAIGYTMAVWAVCCLKDIILTFPGMYTDQVLHWILIIDGWSALTYTVLLAEVVTPGWMTLRRLLLFCLPFAGFTITYAIRPTETTVYAYGLFLWCYAWLVVIVGYVKMRRYLNYIQKNYSNIDEIDVSWLRPVFLFAIIGQLTWLFISFYTNVWADIIYYLFIIVLWCMVLQYSWNFHPITVEDEQKSTNKVNSHNGLPEGMLERLIEEEQLYLKPNLTLNDLAQALGSNRTYVSNYLSQVLHQTFYDYINQMRIERMSIPLLREHPEYKLDYVASQSGFVSMSTFRRAFFKFTGYTPGQYTQDFLSM